MKALVLGATGFLGSHVVRALLARGLLVRVLRREHSDTRAIDGLDVETAIGDLRDAESVARAVRGCCWVFHIAGYYPIIALDRAKAIADGMVTMTNVLRACCDVERFVYTSSLSTIGPAGTEASPYLPRKSAYYQAKFAMEQAALASGLPVVVVNPTYCIGECDVKPTSGILILNLLRGHRTYVDAPTNAVDVRDVAVGHILACEKGRICERYLLGNWNTSFGEVLRVAAEIAGVPGPTVRLPVRPLFWLAVASEWYASKFTKHPPRLPLTGVHLLAWSQHFDSSKAIRELRLPQNPIPDAIRRTIEWFRANGYVNRVPPRLLNG
jgi:Nucleoside-diphosphate-sugar epimerases